MAPTFPVIFSGGTDLHSSNRCWIDFIRITCRVCYTWSRLSAPTPRDQVSVLPPQSRVWSPASLTLGSVSHVMCFVWPMECGQKVGPFETGFKGHHMFWFPLCFCHLPWKEWPQVVAVPSLYARMRDMRSRPEPRPGPAQLSHIQLVHLWARNECL